MAARWAWNHPDVWLARHWALQVNRAPEDGPNGILEGITGPVEPEPAGGPNSSDASNSQRPRMIDAALQPDTPLRGNPDRPGDTGTGLQPADTGTGLQHVQPVAPQPLESPSSDRAIRPLPMPGTPPADQSDGVQPPGWRSPMLGLPTAGGQRRESGLASAAQGLGPDTVAVIRRLHAQDPHDAAEAQAELKRRGFGEREIALARQLSDPDPQTRRRLVRQLPGLAGLDAAPWLVELSRDADAEVRWTALTLLATTNDPALLDRVAELVRGDPDPRIQRLAERLSQAPQK